MIDASKSIAACAEYYGDESNSVKKYLIEGEKKALSIDNRGPILFENDGSLSSSIPQRLFDAFKVYNHYENFNIIKSIVLTINLSLYSLIKKIKIYN